MGRKKKFQDNYLYDALKKYKKGVDKYDNFLKFILDKRISLIIKRELKNYRKFFKGFDKNFFEVLKNREYHNSDLYQIILLTIFKVIDRIDLRKIRRNKTGKNVDGRIIYYFNIVFKRFLNAYMKYELGYFKPFKKLCSLESVNYNKKKKDWKREVEEKVDATIELKAGISDLLNKDLEGIKLNEEDIILQ